MKKEDVTIIGAGPAGMTAALFLAKNNIPVTLIEKKNFPRDKICGDCLGGFALSLLKQIDGALLDRFIKFDKKLVGSGVHFYGPEHQKVTIEAVNMVDQKIKEVALCRRMDFDNFLIDEVKKYSQIELLQNTCITDITRQNNGLLLHNGNNALVTTKLTIISTGSQQLLIHKLHGKRPSRKHMAAGIRGYYEGIKDLNDGGYIELHFLKELAPGYLWIFPLPENIANVGIGLRSDIVSQKNMNLKNLLQDYIMNNAYFKNRFENARQVSSISGFPLALGGSKQSLSGDHFVLAGDAGNLIEPLFGEGIGNAMYSGKFAAEHAIQCLVEGDYSAKFNTKYDKLVYNKLGTTLRFSAFMQKIAFYPGLMSYLFNRVSRNSELQQMLFGIINGKIARTRRNGLELVLKMIFNFN
jgi:geranylgeranyl reductase family protein